MVGLIAGIFGNVIGMKVHHWYWQLFHPVEIVYPFIPPVDLLIIPPVDPVFDPVVDPLIGDFEQLWLDGEVKRVNLAENYLIVQPTWPENAAEVKVVLDPETKIERMKIVEQTINDFKPGEYIVLESKEDVRDKMKLDEISHILLVPPTPPLPM